MNMDKKHFKMNEKKLLALILILALLLRVTFALIVPIFEKPDEKSHFEYVEFIVDNKKLPVQQEGQHGAEFFQPPFYHVLASFILGFVGAFTENTQYRVISLRVLSILVSMFTLFWIYKIASMLFRNNALILGIVAFASFLPSNINMNSAVTNANFGDLLSTLIIYLLLNIMTKKEIQKKDILLLGLVAGVALITRLSIIPVILAIPFAFIIRYSPKIRANIKNIIKPLLVIGVIAIIISGWNFLRNFALYGDFLGINAMKLASLPDEINPDLMFIVKLLGWTFITFWAAFGRTNGIFVGNLDSAGGIALFALFYSFLLVLALLAIYGLYRFLKKVKRDKNLEIGRKKSLFVLAIHLAILSLVFVYFSLYDFQPQGRLFFPAMPAIAVFFTLGMFNCFSKASEDKMLVFYLAFFMLIDIFSVLSILSHYSNF